ncbi:MAG: RNA pseudouridine synthase [Verrucomicrobia bacterium]|nr:MAG: RNA pseudouridine synthase [Verrucomicrobiota bacterium]
MITASALNKPNHSGGFAILAEAGDWIVVNKFAGLLSHPTKPHGPYTLWHGLQQLLAFEIINGGKVALINRLDRETSGIVLVAKTSLAATDLAEAMANGKIHKEYLAIVTGWPAADEFEAALPILRLGEVATSAVWLKRAIHPSGRPAKTLFRVEKRLTHPLAGKISLVRAIPLTGRTHQIRVHLSHLGYPLIGDKLYGVSEQCYLKFIAEGWSSVLQSLLRMERHALHSTRMQIDVLSLQPGSQDFSAAWECGMPSDMRKFLEESKF